jgi:N-acetylglucosaminyldiphosphoundecaprenol N-acetyl-beta-D-mannosaminyltransferase
MKRYFNINFEFEHSKVDTIIFEYIGQKMPGYVCSIDGNNCAVANTNNDHLEVVNRSIVNICDSNWVPILINRIYGTNYYNYCGTELFIKFVKMKKFRQFFLGSSLEVLERLKERLEVIDPAISKMRFETLPFREVEEFDYVKIANIINLDKPDIIWVSLGAPKQEKFMKLLLPHLNWGVMFGFGAIFNVYAEMPGLKRAPDILVKMKLEWLFRSIQEPRKQLKRAFFFLGVLPAMLRQEIKMRNMKGVSSSD